MFTLPDASTIGKLAEIAENLHRRQIDDIERGELIAAWMELRQERKRTLADVSGQVGPKPQGGRPVGGIRAAARDLGMPRKTVERAVKVAALAPEAKAEARKRGVAGNQTVLLEAAKATTPELQVEAIRRDPENGLRQRRQWGLKSRDRGALFCHQPLLALATKGHFPS